MKFNGSNIFQLIISCLIGLALAPDVFSQQTGEVKDQEFIIRKDRVLTLPVQPRRFERLPVLPTPKSNNAYTYEVQPYFLNLEPVAIKSEPTQKNFSKKQEEMYPGFARFGLGNYNSPLLEGRYNLWEGGDYQASAKVFHHGFYSGPTGDGNSAESKTQVALDGNLYKEAFRFFGGVNYDRHMVHFYGFDWNDLNLVDFMPGKNVLNTFQVTGGIEDVDKVEGVNYEGKVFIRAFHDSFEASETEIGILANSDYWFDDALRFDFDMNLSLTGPKDVFYGDINRNYFKIRPSVGYLTESLKIDVGANIVFENDVTSNKGSDFHFFPALYGHYMLAKEFGIYAQFEGDVLRTTYQDFVRENPFLGPSDRLLNTIQNFKTGAGIKGNLLDELVYEVGFNVGRYRNMHFFANSPTDSTRFNLLYDDLTNVVNYRALASWKYDKWYQVTGSVNYYSYSMGTLTAAYHRPEWEVSLNNQIQPTEKWLIQFNANLMGGIQGFNQQSDLSVELPAILDLQLKADYKITERISAFAIGNNLLNRKNQRFLNYPVRGIQGILGATFQF